MAQIICFFLSLLGILLFRHKKYVSFLLLATFLVYDGFGLLGQTIGRTGVDAYTYMCIALLFLKIVDKKYVINIKEIDRIGLSILLILAYSAIRSLFSILLAEESLLYSIKVFRTDLFFLSYFLFVEIDNQDIKSFWYVLTKLIIVVGIIYFLSFILWLSSGQAESMVNYTVMLALSAPLLSLLIFDVKDIKYRYLIIGLYIVFLLSTFSRGLLLATGVAMGYYYIFIKKSRKILIPMLLSFSIFYFLFSLVDSNKSENVSKMSTTEEITNALSFDSYDDFQWGSFGLRFAMVWERGDYLIEHPKDLLFGVGSIHEESPNNKFNFMVGSHKTVDEERSRQMIDTTDVAILSHLFRYGIVWLALFLYFLKTSFSELKKRREYPYVITATLTLIVACVASFSNDFFSELPLMFVPLILLSRSCQYTIREELCKEK